MDPEFELRIDRTLSIFLLIAGSFLFGLFLYSTSFYKTLKHNPAEWILFCLFFITFVMGCYFALNKSVQVTIDKNGIYWYDKLFKIKKNKILLWNQIQSCYLSDNTSRGVQDLNFNFTEKTTNKEFKLSLNAYDKSSQEIYQAIEYYSKKYKFGFLGLESLE